MTRTTSMSNSYRIGNQIKLAKHRLYIGQATVGIQVRRTRKEMNPMHTVVDHFPRAANRSRLRARIAMSTPKTRVTFPTKKIALKIVSQAQGSNPRMYTPGSVIIASPRHCLDKTLLREVLCTATNIICWRTAPQASTSGNVSAACTFRRALKRLAIISANFLRFDYYLLLPGGHLQSRCSTCIRDDTMDRQKRQGQAKSSQGQMHCPQRLNLCKLKIRDQSPGSILCSPWHLTNGRDIERHIEVRPGIEMRVLREPFFHVASLRREVYKKVNRLAGNQQRLKGSKVHVFIEAKNDRR